MTHGYGMHQPAAPVSPGRASMRWLVAVLVGVGLAVPFGILLSYVAFLLAYLGLFFYALFGLFIGAVVARIAAGWAPIEKKALTGGTSLIVLTGLAVSWAWEIRGLPGDMSRQALRSIVTLPAGMSKQDFIRSVENKVRQSIERDYPPGGAIGYVKWVIAGGKFEKGTIEGVRRELSRPQRRWIWAIRVVLSVVLFAYGISAVTWPLTQPRARTRPPSTDGTIHA